MKSWKENIGKEITSGRKNEELKALLDSLEVI